MEPPLKRIVADVGIDVLSNLPDDIVHHILELSGFQILDVVQLSVLSKRWNHLCFTMPYLDVDMHHLYSSRFGGVQFDDELAGKFTRFLDWVLSRQGDSSLVRFKLRFNELFDKVDILRWLSVVAERNVQELDVMFVFKPLAERNVPELDFEFLPSGDFPLPLRIAQSDSLRVLKLCLDSNLVEFPDVVRLNRLKSLHLYRVDFPDIATLQRLFSGCCSLERFKLDSCTPCDFGSLDFSSTRLKELIIRFTFDFIEATSFKYEIKVSCPNLILFEYFVPAEINLVLQNVSSLESAWVESYALNCKEECQVGKMLFRNLKEVRNVSNLRLDLNVVYCLSNVVDELICCQTLFPKLKSLNMLLSTINKYTQVMFLLLDHCPNLEVFTLDSEQYNMYKDEEDAEWDDEHWELQCEGIVSWKSHPHLKTIKVVGFRGDDYELDFLRFLLKNAKSLEKLDITWCPFTVISVELNKKVLMFPKASPGTVITFPDPERIHR